MENDLPPPTPPPLPPPILPAKKSKAGRGWKIATLLLAVCLAVSLFSNVAHFFFNLVFNAAGAGLGNETRLEEVVLERHGSANKVAVVPIEGIISSSGLDGAALSMVQLVEDQLKLAAKDDHVKAVLLKVNSPGGEVLASDDIYRAIVKFQNEQKKPVIASMGSLAASGGYYVSAACRWIVANDLTLTGSIGVIMHAYNYRGLMNKVGLRPMVYKSGRFKDMLSGERDLEKLSPGEKMDVEEEDAMITRMIQETFEKFKTIVAEGRQKANTQNKLNKDGATGRLLSDEWKSLADGRVLTGKEAFANGFVDELGNWRAAVDRAQKIAGIEKADLVTYQMPFGLGNLLGLFGKSDAKGIKIDLGFDLPKLGAGLYYLSPTFLR